MTQIGLIGGSGLNHWHDQRQDQPQWVETPYGKPSAPIEHWQTDQHHIYFLARHGSPHHLPPHRINYRANIAALQQLGCTAIFAVNAVGGIHPEMREAPHVVIPDQLIDYTYSREHSYSNEQQVQHCEFGEPFDATLREQLIAAASVLGMPISERGVYGCTQGPRLETAAEIRRLQQDGCDIVGMTAMPEAALARELNIPYASVCLVVNAAAGLSAQPIQMQEIERALQIGMHSVKRLLHTCLNFRLPS
jgi:5'-methylthioinosine phosphorylase